MASKKEEANDMAPLPERAYQGIKDAKAGKDLGQYVCPSKPGKSLRSPIEIASATRDMRKNGGKTTSSMEGMKPKKRLDRRGRSDSVDEEDDRIARKNGGKAQGKTNINILIGAPGAPGNDGAQNMQPLPPPAVSRPPMASPPLPPPPMQLPPTMMPPQMGPGMGPPMPRKNGGKTSSYQMDSGGEGGLGRLEKAKWYGKK